MDKAALRIRRDKLKRELKAVERELDKPTPGHSIFCNCVDCGGCKYVGCDQRPRHDSGYCQDHRCPTCSYVGKLVPCGSWETMYRCPRCAKHVREYEKDVY